MKKKKEIIVDVKEYWIFIIGIRDVVEFERYYYNGIEILFVLFVFSKRDLVFLETSFSYYFEFIE